MRPRTGTRPLLLLLPVMLLLPGGGSLPGQPAGDRSPGVVQVDAGKALGPLPFMFRSGVAIPYEYALGPAFETFFGDLKPGAVELMPIRDGDFSSLKEFVDRLPRLSVTRWATETRRHGGTPVISLKEVPRWLRRDATPDAYLKPPRDLSGWADYVQAVVQFYNNRLHVDAEYVVWDEPDHKLFWKGTEEEYLTLYRYSVLGARRADPRAKIGGPAVSGWSNKRAGSTADRPMLFNFIRYCASTQLKELGLGRLPIDVIVWHQFDTDAKGNPLLFAIPAQQIRAWLKQFGYDPATRLNLGAWNTWTGFGRDVNELSPERDTEFAAAYAIQALEAMERAGIEEHMFFSLFEKWQWDNMTPARREKEFKDKEFFGGFGLLTKDRIIKPVFNAFKLLSMLEGERLSIRSDDPYLTVIASRSADKAVVLLSNFVWPKEGLLAVKARVMLAQGYPQDEMASWAAKLSPQVVSEFESGKLPVNSLPIPESAKSRLQALSYLDEVYRSRNESKRVTIKIQSLPFAGPVTMERYVVDSRQGNSFRSGQEIDEAFLQAKREAISQVGELLIGWSLVPPDFRRWDEAQQSKEIQARTQGLSGDRRRKVEDTLKTIGDQLGDRVNHSPQVQLQDVSQQHTLQPGPVIELSTEMTPYSVQVIVLKTSG